MSLASLNLQSWRMAHSHRPSSAPGTRSRAASSRIPVDRALRRCERGGVKSESLGLTCHKQSCNCTGCGLLRAGVCINCAEKIAALILEFGLRELAVEPCSGAGREAIELYFSTPPERWRAPRAL